MTREETVRKIKELVALDSDSLDDLVCEEFSCRASQVNNEGVECQIDFLIESGFSIEDILQSIE